jgi:hypothetical protein
VTTAVELHADLAASRQAIGLGEATQLCWILLGARSAVIEPDIGDIPAGELEKGCRTVAPKQTTTYVISATAADGRVVKKQLIVEVRVLAVQIIEFVARSAIIRPGETTQLCWTVANARSVRIEPEVGSLSRFEMGRGCREVAPRQTTTYFLTAEGADGRTVTAKVLVAVALR